MKTKIVHIGDVELVDYPFIINSEDWLIPKNWYLLDSELSNRPSVVYNNNKPVIVIEHTQISYNLDDKEYRLSVIKTDKKLELDDIIVYK